MARARVNRNHVRELFEQNPTCGICLKPVDTLAEATGDHVIPYSKGGMNRVYNIQLAHNRCNNRKADKLPDLDKRTLLNRIDMGLTLSKKTK